ncbi:MAG: hypothetical protein P8127_15000 [Acidobacteriota bacterium]
MSKPTFVRLVCWKKDRAAELEATLEAAGFTVDAGALDGPGLRALGQSTPDAVVIDLGRLPSQGRDVGISLRSAKGSRGTPLVFVDGAQDKVARTREILPDAVYASADDLASAVRQAIAEPPADPVVPGSNFAGYAGTPLPKKLGVRQNSRLALVGAPADFMATLGKLPAGVGVNSQTDPDAEVTLWFLTSRTELEEGIDRMAEIAGGGRLWVCWPKKSSGISSDVTQPTVRAIGLAAGLVDFKICAIDATWSGLCFTRRKK